MHWSYGIPYIPFCSSQSDGSWGMACSCCSDSTWLVVVPWRFSWGGLGAFGNTTGASRGLLQVRASKLQWNRQKTSKQKQTEYIDLFIINLTISIFLELQLSFWDLRFKHINHLKTVWLNIIYPTIFVRETWQVKVTSPPKVRILLMVC